jgi:hypothetical protein
MHSNSGDSDVLSLTFNLLESFSKIFPNLFLIIFKIKKENIYISNELMHIIALILILEI